MCSHENQSSRAARAARRPSLKAGWEQVWKSHRCLARSFDLHPDVIVWQQVEAGAHVGAAWAASSPRMGDQQFKAIPLRTLLPRVPIRVGQHRARETPATPESNGDAVRNPAEEHLDLPRLDLDVEQVERRMARQRRRGPAQPAVGCSEVAEPFAVCRGCRTTWSDRSRQARCRLLRSQRPGRRSPGGGKSHRCSRSPPCWSCARPTRALPGPGSAAQSSRHLSTTNSTQRQEVWKGRVQYLGWFRPR